MTAGELRAALKDVPDGDHIVVMGHYYDRHAQRILAETRYPIIERVDRNIGMTQIIVTKE